MRPRADRPPGLRYPPRVPIAQAVAFALGLALVGRTALGAVRTFVVPRGDNDRLNQIAFHVVRSAFGALASPARPYATRDRIMAYYGPVSLMLLPAWWLVLICIGYTAMFWGLGVSPLTDAFVDSGSSLLTLGFARPAVRVATSSPSPRRLSAWRWSPS